ncbi:unnamed protein product [Urochloa humidicola]
MPSPLSCHPLPPVLLALSRTLSSFPRAAAAWRMRVLFVSHPRACAATSSCITPPRPRVVAAAALLHPGHISTAPSRHPTAAAPLILCAERVVASQVNGGSTNGPVEWIHRRDPSLSSVCASNGRS